ncbi:MAG: tetratricopeptide repeat protein [Solirubrobacteraceae bacterium]
MTLRRPSLLFAVLAVAGAFAAALAAFALVNRSGSAPAGPEPAADVQLAPPGAPTDAVIRGYQRLVRARPDVPDAYAALAGAYLQKVRETGDPGFYARAAAVLARGARIGGGPSYRILAAQGTLALARHDFRRGLALGLAARRANPASNAAFPVIVDAQVELGRYAEAGRTLQEFVDRKPGLPSYARASYFRELHGDLAGAAAAMRLAVSSAGAAGENPAYVQTLLGSLEFARGRLGAATAEFRSALAADPGFVPASAGLAKVHAARGKFGPAIAQLRAAVARLPLPEYVTALGETELAAGRPAAARRDLALVGAEERLLRAGGVNTDVDLALFEANHGSPARAVLLARRSWRDAPSVRSADALGWALTSAGQPRAGLAWARRALRLGSRDATFHYHAGMTARAAGRRALGRHWLRLALAGNPRFSPLYGPRAQRALAAS